jgi:peptidoglycan/LPS O-acetylase OafA/YrhL
MFPTIQGFENNFDLLRLAAALQVFGYHALTTLHLAGPVAATLGQGLRLFPGVPMFFVISGFLVSRSYERSPSISAYFRNRCLRILPALWGCLVVSLGVLIVGVGSLGPVSCGGWLLWWGAQMTVFQQYDPAFLQPLGTGILNAALWTIPVELQFYVLLPLIYRRGVLSGLAGLSLAAHLAIEHQGFWPWLALYSFAFTTVIPYLWMFLAGVLLQRSWKAVGKYFIGRAHWWLSGYLALCAYLLARHIQVHSAAVGPLVFFPLAGLVISVAMTRPVRGLRHQDISYGVYLYHMPVINLLVELRLAGTWRSFAVALVGTLALAALSWVLVERPFLRQKARPGWWGPVPPRSDECA